MKKTIYLPTVFVLACTAVFIQGCEKETLIKNNPSLQSSNEKTVKVGNLTAKLPDGYDAKIASFNENDWKKVFNKKARSKSDNGEITIQELADICQPILDKYPDLSNLSDQVVSEVSDDFGGISEEVIIENKEIIEDYYMSFATYDIIEAIAEGEGEKAGTSTIGGYVPGPKTDPYFDGLNLAELFLLSLNPRYVEGTKAAAQKSAQMTLAYFQTTSQPWRTKGDAFRHSLWNVLICKYVAAKNENVSECMAWAKAFTDAHEQTDGNYPSTWTDEMKLADHGMDYHNNNIGRELFLSTAYYYKECWLCQTKLICPSEGELANVLFWQRLPIAKKCNTVSEMALYPTKLVYTLD